METIDFNVNNYVMVKLTDIGLNELKRQHDELAADLPYLAGFKNPETDENGWSKWQMHDLMNRFGHLMPIGFNVPFETNIKLQVSE